MLYKQVMLEILKKKYYIIEHKLVFGKWCVCAERDKLNKSYLP